jgi:dolichol-phosphate mannosyltransferase
MHKNKVVVIIPCYKCSRTIGNVIKAMPEFVKHIILINDCCPEIGTKIELNRLKSMNSKIILLENNSNLGVGGAFKKGLIYLNSSKEIEFDFVVKVDSDDQMDLSKMHFLIEKCDPNKFHFAKGNRFFNLESYSQMPKIRIIGNIGMSFLLKAASGYWKVMDPTNGYFCMSKNLATLIPLNKLSNRFFFESSLLAECYYLGTVIFDVNIPARYGDEKSNLSIRKVLFEFPPKLFKLFVKRITIRYFFVDFSIISVFLILGFFMVLFGLIFGFYFWYISISQNQYASTGTVMLAVLPLVLGFQLLLSVINYEITSENPFKRD